MAFGDLLLILAIHTLLSSPCWSSSLEEWGAVPRNFCAFAYASPSGWKTLLVLLNLNHLLQQVFLDWPHLPPVPCLCLAPFYLAAHRKYQCHLNPLNCFAMFLCPSPGLVCEFLEGRHCVLSICTLSVDSQYIQCKFVQWQFVKKYQCLSKRLWMDTCMTWVT